MPSRSGQLRRQARTSFQCLGFGIPEICEYIQAVPLSAALLHVKPLAKMAFALQTRGLTARVGSKVSTEAVRAVLCADVHKQQFH